MMSPSPVAPQAPTSSSTYAAEPAIGPSPTLQRKERMPLVACYKESDNFIKASLLDDTSWFSCHNYLQGKRSIWH